MCVFLPVQAAPCEAPNGSRSSGAQEQTAQCCSRDRQACRPQSLRHPMNAHFAVKLSDIRCCAIGRIAPLHDRARATSGSQRPCCACEGSQARHESVRIAGLTAAGLLEPPGRCGIAGYNTLHTVTVCMTTIGVLEPVDEAAWAGKYYNVAALRCLRTLRFVSRWAGPKTIHFWAPTFKWGISLANIADFKRPAEQARRADCLQDIMSILPSAWTITLTCSHACIPRQT